jgi:flagellar hook-associated protein 2
VADSTATKVNSGDLGRRQIGSATLLSSLNGGAGIEVGDFNITDTNGVTQAIDLNKIDDVAVTVGDVIDRINSADLGVRAEINERGDGIKLIDTVGGNGKIKVTAVGNSTTAADLHLLGESSYQSVNGNQTHVIDGTAAVSVTIDADDKLSDVVEKINALGAGVTASILNDGNGQRLAITSDKSGAANEFVFDTSNSTLALEEIAQGRDALLQFGSSGANGALISSGSNTFSNVVDGLDVTINDISTTPVTVTVKSTSNTLTQNVKEFVSSYNSLRDVLDKTTSFDPDALTTGILFGSSAALRIDSVLSNIVTSRFFGVGQFDSLAAVGISINDKGKLSLDESKLTTAFNKDPEAIKKLFADKNRGLAHKLDDAVEKIAGTDDNSLLTARNKALTDAIDANNLRLDQMTTSLDKQRNNLLLTFYNLETTISKLQSNLTALSSLQIVPPLTSSS